jgi:hypothetical protein
MTAPADRIVDLEAYRQAKLDRLELLARAEAFEEHRRRVWAIIDDLEDYDAARDLGFYERELWATAFATVLEAAQQIGTIELGAELWADSGPYRVGHALRVVADATADCGLTLELRDGSSRELSDALLQGWLRLPGDHREGVAATIATYRAALRTRP